MGQLSKGLSTENCDGQHVDDWQQSHCLKCFDKEWIHRWVEKEAEQDAIAAGIVDEAINKTDAPSDIEEGMVKWQG